MNYLFKLIIFLLLLMQTLIAKSELKKVTLQLSWFDQFQFAGYYIAKEKGFYKELGLDVEIKPFQFGIDIPQEVSDNTIDFAIGRETLILERAKNKKVVALYALFQISPLILLSTKESQINAISDFKNKKIMTTIDDASEVSLKAMINSQNVNLNDFNFLKHTHNIKDLVTKKTDVISAYISKSPFHLQKMGISYNVFEPKKYGFDMYSDLLYTSEQMISEDIDTARAFKKASLMGWKYAYSHIEESAQLIYTKYNTQNLSKEELLFEGEELKKLSFYNTNTLGSIDKNKLQRITDLYNVMGLLNHKIDINEFVYNDNIHQLKLTSEEQKYLQDKKEITMCIDPDWMPFEKFDKYGKHIGMTADYYKIFKEKLDIEIKVIKTKTWSQSLENAKNRKCDILSLVMETLERKKYLNFTTPYLETPLVIATSFDVLFIEDIKLIKNKTVGITKGYAFVEILKQKYKNLNIVEVDNIEDGLNKVNQGKLFGYIGTLYTVGYSLQTKFIGEVKIAGKFNENWELGIGIRNDDKILLNIFNKVIGTIETQTKQQILNNWVSIKYEKGIDYSLVWKILIIVFIVVLFILYRQYMLKQSIKSLDKIIDSTMEAIAIFKNGKLIKVNQVFLDMYGYDSINTILGKNASHFVGAKEHPYLKKQLTKSRKPYELNMIKKDNTIFPALVKGTQVNKKVRITSVIDLTELKKKDLLLFEQSKLASMGEMIGNISHQWRQPLSVISTGASGMKLQKEVDCLSNEAFYKTCDVINDNAQYLSKTIDDFKNFIKGDRSKKRFDLRDAINSFLNLVEGSIKSNDIHIIENLEENIKIDGYENELIQCFMNIFNNAKDVLKENVTNKEKRVIFISAFMKNDNVVIKIKDNAGGILESILPRIFEPYFTTKHKSQGTGLGLHMTYNLIVDGMRGTIEASNVKYKYDGQDYVGAEFTVTLPER